MTRVPRFSVLALQFTRFGMVGVVGFIVDTSTFLFLGHVAGIQVYPARALAFVPATLATWMLNRRFVFRTSSSGGRKRDEYARHLGTQTFGIAINFLVFWLAVRSGLGRGSAQVVPLMLGSIAAMLFNFAGARLFVFRQPPAGNAR